MRLGNECETFFCATIIKILSVWMKDDESSVLVSCACPLSVPVLTLSYTSTVRSNSTRRLPFLNNSSQIFNFCGDFDLKNSETKLQIPGNQRAQGPGPEGQRLEPGGGNVAYLNTPRRRAQS